MSKTQIESHFHVGDILQFNQKTYVVIGRIVYKDNLKYKWHEYRLSQLGSKEEIWLSIDEGDCIYWEMSDKLDYKKFELLESGIETVIEAYNKVDVYTDDSARFLEYYDKEHDQYFSIEEWGDETEYSIGKKIGFDSIRKTKDGKSEARRTHLKDLGLAILIYGGFSILCLGVTSIISYIEKKNNTITAILEKSQDFKTVTHITGKGKKYATVYKYINRFDTDSVTKFIIDKREGNTSSIQQDPIDSTNIGILTDEEFCLIYYPTINNQRIDTLYVHVATRDWTIENLEEPLYNANDNIQNFYVEAYEKSAFEADSISNQSAGVRHRRHHYFTPIRSSYDSYSSTVREVSRSRRNSGGGHSGGGK